ncbi:5-oxoprolinase subunit C family protein [Herbiconiux daphne]|uniref:Biotin-dependent carboxyltransferase family protein n=1 Tax=Herbiconiux daphne TaxID=2970914 RepID=A0ABT2GZB3_9MICO|nr:biotin-dependent carboxyltransferase family protein [Herbiconiux daphne]MCS5733299.1 biotin-dependent carboxyltransferase family protein [Herbiconiux daphne]
MGSSFSRGSGCRYRGVVMNSGTTPPNQAAWFDVVAGGPLTLLQDAGRPGYAHLGVTASGAADRAAYTAANRLVGNRPGAACLETVFGGLELVVRHTALLAVTGAPAFVIVTRAAGSADKGEAATEPCIPAARETVVPTGYSFTVWPGDRVRLVAPERGLRNYVAVRGGFDAEPTLGSRSTDVLSRLGPPAIAAGDHLAVADEAGEWPAAESIPPRRSIDGPALLHVTRGPRDDWFGDSGWQTLLSGTWTVGIESNRVGIRLGGERRIDRLPGRGGELPSEGMVAGAVQVPPSGQPVVFLRDHPVTGGYPVIGVLTAAALDAAAQLRPGDSVRLAASVASNVSAAD